MSFKFEKLIVWQKSLDLSALVNDIAAKFPKEQMYVLASQIAFPALIFSFPFEIKRRRMNVG